MIDISWRRYFIDVLTGFAAMLACRILVWHIAPTMHLPLWFWGFQVAIVLLASFGWSVRVRE